MYKEQNKRYALQGIVYLKGGYVINKEVKVLRTAAVQLVHLLFLFCLQGVKLAGLDWAVDNHATVLVRPHVTRRQDAASVPQDGQDRGVKKVDNTLLLAKISVYEKKNPNPSI